MPGGYGSRGSGRPLGSALGPSTPTLPPRLRDVAPEPNFSILFGSGSGRISFPYVVERLLALAPLDGGERQVLRWHLERYLDIQLRTGSLANLKEMETLLEPLGLDDLRLPDETATALEQWSTRLSAADLTALESGYRLRSEGIGTFLESPWFNDFVPNWRTGGLECARRDFAVAYLTANNAWVKAHGIAPEEIELLLRARGTLRRLAPAGPRPRARRALFPRTLKTLLPLLGLPGPATPAKRGP